MDFRPRMLWFVGSEKKDVYVMVQRCSLATRLSKICRLDYSYLRIALVYAFPSPIRRGSRARTKSRRNADLEWQTAMRVRLDKSIAAFGRSHGAKYARLSGADNYLVDGSLRH
jgi:hypothetical protein